MSGIFAYLNYNLNKERSYVLQALFNGIQRLDLEDLAFDSVGVAIDSSPALDPNAPPFIFRQEGNIESLVSYVYQRFKVKPPPPSSSLSPSLSPVPWPSRKL